MMPLLDVLKDLGCEMPDEEAVIARFAENPDEVVWTAALARRIKATAPDVPVRLVVREGRAWLEVTVRWEVGNGRAQA
jgi:hypothetical protein